jgi:dTMP kinase
MGASVSESEPSGQGKFIVIEGPDGAGTTTQANALARFFEARGQSAFVTQQPSPLPVGRLIRERLQARSEDPELAEWRSLALLFAADRLDHVAQEIEPRLAEGEHVICDRYQLSSLVYQGLHAPDTWVYDLNRFARRPDCTLLLRVPLQECWRRQQERGEDREVYDDQQLQEEVHRRYEQLGSRGGSAIVDGSGEVEAVTARCLDALRDAGVLEAVAG